jgi:hypothetical protein
MPSMLISSCVARPGMTSGFWRKALPHPWVLASFNGVRRRAGKRVNQPLKAEALRQCSKSNCFKADVTAQCLDENAGTYAQRAVLRPVSNLRCCRRKPLSPAFRFHMHRTAFRPKALRH